MKKTNLLGGKRLYVLLATMMCLSFAGILQVKQANAETSGEYEYTVSGDSATITKYNIASAGAVTVPEKLDGKTVTAIADGAFKLKDVTTVTIPKTVTSIGSEAFYGCTKLTSVTVEGDALAAIGDKAFAKCATGAGLNYTIDAIQTVYGGTLVFDGTTLSSVACKQSSTTYTYVADKTNTINYRGPHFESLTASVSIGATTTLDLKNSVGAITWSSSDASIATVDNGVVTGVKDGEVTIYAENAGEKIGVTVTVLGLKISNKKVTITKGYSKSISVKNGNEKVSGVIWTSENPNVATVSEQGKIKAVNIGKTVINAKVGEITYNCTVTVKANKATITKYSKSAKKVYQPILAFGTIERTAKGYEVKGHMINGSYQKIQYIKGSSITVKVGKKVIAKKSLGKIKLNLKSKKTKALSFHFTGKQIKKNMDLRGKHVVVSVSADTQYFYETTRIVTKEVSREEAEAMQQN